MERKKKKERKKLQRDKELLYRTFLHLNFIVVFLCPSHLYHSIFNNHPISHILYKHDFIHLLNSTNLLFFFFFNSFPAIPIFPRIFNSKSVFIRLKTNLKRYFLFRIDIRKNISTDLFFVLHFILQMNYYYFQYFRFQVFVFNILIKYFYFQNEFLVTRIFFCSKIYAKE